MPQSWCSWLPLPDALAPRFCPSQACTSLKRLSSCFLFAGDRYCFRWPQFIGDSDLRFAQKDAISLFEYLSKHKSVTDILFTGGDPLIMKTSVLKEYLERFKNPSFLKHVKNLRIGTRALSFWPQRFLGDEDAEELLQLLRDLREKGGRHVAVMAHIAHGCELKPADTRRAIAALQDAGVVIRSQAPLMRGINDDAEVWAAKWREEVSLGIVPYYMFVARDTGAQDFFSVPLAEAHRIYSDAIRYTSGLCRTVRGPSMSGTPGKVEIVGVEVVGQEPAFVLRFLQCRDPDWIGRIFFAKLDPNAIWYDELRPLEGMRLPWDAAGMLRRHRPSVALSGDDQKGKRNGVQSP
eukprot:scaffold180_cov311-Pinguiococcus_pyrenoidosus.AAC.42